MTAIAADPASLWRDCVAGRAVQAPAGLTVVTPPDGDPESDHAAGATAATGAAPTGPSVLEAGSIARGDLVRSIDQLGRRAVPPLSVPAELAGVLPRGLVRGQTVSVAGSISLLLALLGSASADGAWCALVGLPPISVEAALEYGVDPSRLAIVPTPGASWLTAVGALLDAVDIVVVRPPAQVSDADIRRLGARVRTRAAVLMPYLTGGTRWPRADCAMSLTPGRWDGLGEGHGRLRSRRVTVEASGRSGRGRDGRPLRVSCWLPAREGGVGHADVDAGQAPVDRPVLDQRAG